MDGEKKLWKRVQEEMKCDPIELSWHSSYAYRHTLQGFMHILARYKFAVKMMQNKKNLRVLDVGCNDGMGDLMIKQYCDCKEVLGIDFDHEAIEWGSKNLADNILRFLETDFFTADLEWGVRRSCIT